jgi:4-nitrophenyl phosphatase
VQDDIFTSSQATAHYVSSLPREAFDPATQSVLTVGEAGIASELRARGITRIIEARLLFPGGRNLSKAELSAQEVDPTIGCVIVGIDAEFSYSKAAYALTALSRLRDPQGDRRSEANRQALFISTNQDSTLPTAGQTLPGAGSVVAMIASCASRTPINIGKPEARMLDLALEAFPRLQRKRVLMVGDRLDTDVLFGINGQVDTLLVTRTGIHNLDDAKRMGIQPTFECDDVTQMLDAEQQ